MAEKADNKSDKTIKKELDKPSYQDVKLPKLVESSTVPATSDFSPFYNPSKNAKKVLDKTQPPLLRQRRRCKSALPTEAPRYMEHRLSLTGEGPLSFSFAIPRGQDSMADAYEEEFGGARAATSEEQEWNDIQELLANFEAQEAGFIQKMQRKLDLMRRIWTKKLKDLRERNYEQEKELEESDKLLKGFEQAKIDKDSALDQVDSLDKEISDLKVRLARKEKECYCLRSEIEKKEGKMKAVVKELSIARVTELNLENLGSVLDLCRTLNSGQQLSLSEQEDIKKRILMRMKRMHRIQSGQLWCSWTM